MRGGIGGGSERGEGGREGRLRGEGVRGGIGMETRDLGAKGGDYGWRRGGDWGLVWLGKGFWGGVRGREIVEEVGEEIGRGRGI